jgi:hypothetical protein
MTTMNNKKGFQVRVQRPGGTGQKIGEYTVEYTYMYIIQWNSIGRKKKGCGHGIPHVM